VNVQIIYEMRIILVDDSMRRGTQLQDLLREKIWPYRPKEIHGRIASPPQMYPCIFDLSTRRRDLATCRAIKEIEEDKEVNKYADENTEEYKAMVEGIRKTIGFTTLRFQTLGNLIEAVVETKNNKGLKREDLCLYCWTGKS
jgi:amidophosphoribosyltransferase